MATSSSARGPIMQPLAVSHLSYELSVYLGGGLLSDPLTSGKSIRLEFLRDTVYWNDFELIRHVHVT